MKLADALSAAGRFAAARSVFERLIESFGRKRSPERAELHYRLARVAKESGDAARAESELDIATKMDLGHAPAMRMLAELCQEQGDLERAERTYRSLLMLVRRKKADELDTIGPSEVFYALSSIASARGQKGQADELLESAMEAATQNDAEARRFQNVLRERKQTDLLMRLLDARMKLAQEPAVRAEILDAKADVLAEAMNKPIEALNARLSALELAPESDALHATRARAGGGAGVARPLPRPRQRHRRRSRRASATIRTSAWPRACCCAWARRSSRSSRTSTAPRVCTRASSRRVSTWRWPGWRWRVSPARAATWPSNAACWQASPSCRPSKSPRTNAAKRTSRWSSSSSATRSGVTPAWRRSRA